MAEILNEGETIAKMFGHHPIGLLRDFPRDIVVEPIFGDKKISGDRRRAEMRLPNIACPLAARRDDGQSLF
ncbi:hypothetical protein OMP38_00430 [Cohnella ginsengisoli]|uniref:Uncharacterized protein n=1 Tax=Cohnella ginsengisoli TaxID=425004 RepID=A0A9X4QKT9_9BACL|nr:hypothetical protein [Cohnella ginsengisoli]MDG0789486.1 hypothetical protein [Cohnella ginsengisoli]